MYWIALDRRSVPNKAATEYTTQFPWLTGSEQTSWHTSRYLYWSQTGQFISAKLLQHIAVVPEKWKGFNHSSLETENNKTIALKWVKKGIISMQFFILPHSLIRMCKKKKSLNTMMTLFFCFLHFNISSKSSLSTRPFCSCKAEVRGQIWGEGTVSSPVGFSLLIPPSKIQTRGKFTLTRCVAN